jgi:molecular chaperone HscB
MKYYEALDLAPRLAIDLEDLKKRFYDRSRQWHPDRFSRASADEQERALEMTAVLNDSFRVLRDPVARAEYFLRERGLELSKDAPPELLEEVFEFNMALEELRSGDESARRSLEGTRAKFTAMQQDADTELDKLFAGYDASQDAATLDKIRATLNRRRYISNLVRDAGKELNVHVAN